MYRGHLRLREGVDLQQLHSIPACPLTHKGSPFPRSEPAESHTKQLALCMLSGSLHKTLAVGRAPCHRRRVTAHAWGPSVLLLTLSSTGKLATRVHVLTPAQLTMGPWISPLSFQVPPRHVGTGQYPWSLDCAPPLPGAPGGGRGHRTGLRLQSLPQTKQI